MNSDATTGSPTDAFVHWCESCGREELLTPGSAYEAGWDFPPRMGVWGVVSPRTCPDCGIKTTVWWAMSVKKLTIDELTPEQRKVVGRILEEVPPGIGSETA